VTGELPDSITTFDSSFRAEHVARSVADGNPKVRLPAEVGFAEVVLVTGRGRGARRLIVPSSPWIPARRTTLQPLSWLSRAWVRGQNCFGSRHFLRVFRSCVGEQSSQSRVLL